MRQGFGQLRVKCQKARLSRQGAQFSPNTSHVIQKRTVNATCAMGHQANSAHCYKFIILQQICSTQYLTLQYYFGTGEEDEYPGSIPDDTIYMYTYTYTYTIHIDILIQYIYINIYKYICIYKYMKTENGSPGDFLNLFIICSSCKWKFSFFHLLT